MKFQTQPSHTVLECFQLLLPAMKECLCIQNEQIIMASETALKTLGWNSTALIGKPFAEILAPLGSTPLAEAIHHQEALQNINAFLKKKDNRTFMAECSVFFLEETSQARYAVVTFTPQQEKTLSMRPLFESNMFGMVYADTENKILDANDAFLNMVDYSLEDFAQGKIGWRELTSPEYLHLDEDAIQQLKDYGSFTPFENQLIRRNGDLVDVFMGGVLEEGTTDHVIAFVIDVSAKKRAERATIKGEELFRRMADSSNVLIWYFTPDFKLHYINRASENLVGKTIEEWPDWEWIIHPDDLVRTQELLAAAFAHKAYYENMTRILQPSGQYRWVFSSGNPVYSDAGEFLGYIGTGVDIHDLKEAQAQLTRYTEKLEQSNKELEHFATIASHDLQEPLRKVLLFTDHLQKVDGALLSETGADDLKRIQNAATRMKRLINDLLDLSRITRRGAPFEKVDLQYLTREVLAELSYFHQDVKNRVAFDGDMSIQADYNQIHQMLTQLLDNALKFHKEDQPSSVKIHISSPEKDHCQITISDDGLGMKADQLSKIFDAFVRLHHGAEYPGTGIGLALVKKIVERHNGSITVESMPGKGSNFIVTLPVTQKDMAT